MSSIDSKIVVFKDKRLDKFTNGAVGECHYPADTKFIYKMVVRLDSGLYEVLDSFNTGSRDNTPIETVYVKKIHVSDI